jgi:hypothetical protein
MGAGELPAAGDSREALSAWSASQDALLGHASIDLEFPKAGNHGITATYAGDGNFVGSSSQTFTLIVVR